MKNIILSFILTMVTIASFGQQSKQINYSNPYVKTTGWSFDVPDGIVKGLGSLGFIRICSDKSNKNFWLEHYVITPYNVDEIVDEQGRHICGQYTINTGKHIYLKLDNNEIITLTCNYRSKIHTDYYTGNTGVYKQYDMYSYFLLNSNIIEKLKNHKIIKMRCEMKFEVKDMNLDKEIDCNESFNTLNELYTKKYNEDHNINELNNNPLKDF